MMLPEQSSAGTVSIHKADATGQASRATKKEWSTPELRVEKFTEAELGLPAGVDAVIGGSRV
ncbi:MAG TPA: hypothetical protein VHW24_28735 [Bryobacteraceae bacterium]|jgi:hypothetical protein|nr:hypothetical protein [Bryobacteraceae bacterium]